METGAIPADVIEAIRSFMKAELRPLDVADVDVKTAPDHDGDPSLFIEVRYRDNGRPIDPKQLAMLLTNLRNQLYHKGEFRFPYIRHHFSETQKVAGYN